ncbi:hemolysin family protein [Bacillus sp. 31A1R]|uniref:Hemolysin family protein n=1 Tax=Robertmurraya mangrovi TaxID=3098077 RepID=A0ABU5ISR3_9BACI|nr:hemolysin family protein [Bacillus sp. 31A1R]MDZ5470148.1 hemolysin family protein [Bacillus sp. 31A1R]
MTLLNLLLVAILIGFTAFFVAAEFAIVKVRSSRIDQLLEENKTGAKPAKQIITHLDEYLSACQLGITITALGLGWLGEPTVEEILRPIFHNLNLNPSMSHILSFGIAFAFITFLHVVVGELAPKTIAIQKAEEVSLLFARPLIFFYKLMFPFIWILNGSARILVGLVGFKPASEGEIAHSEEELRILLSESYESGEINQSELTYMNNIFEFDNRIAKEIMVPRTEIITLAADSTLQEIVQIVEEEKYTRYPVIEGDKDNIVGIINIKEILTDCIQQKCEGDKPLLSYIKPVITVIESIPIHDLLLKMQKERSHMAILSDEYGGTAGLVTVEDILEEIVGEIHDEFDTDEIPLIQHLDEHHYILDAKMLIMEVNDLLGITLEEDEVDTIGGWLLTQRFDLEQEDFIEEEGYMFIVKEIEGHHIKYIEIKKSIEDNKN